MPETKEIIDKIKALVKELEGRLGGEDRAIFAQNFDALEIPDLIILIVDYLQPLLHPYEAAIYWYLFRNSIIETGQQYCRASTKGMMSGVIQSSSGQSGDLSYTAVQKALAGLEEKAIISKAGNTTREGTLYKINLPEEIELCQELMKNSKREISQPIDEKKQLDYYNIAENRLKVFERDNYKCHYCNKQLTRFTATLDHIQPASEGGDNSYENLVTACLHCNSRRGSKPVMEMYVNNNKESG
jgi:hypothetical protein